MNLNGKEIRPGEETVLNLDIASLPSGTRIDLKIHVYRAVKPGPTLLLIGGLHGDEINGVEIVRRSMRKKLFKKLKRGTVIAVPLLNVYGFISFSREFPGGKDVNRSFPGKKSGSLASRIARTLTKVVLPHVDFALDFHTGGAGIHNYPQSRVYGKDKRSIDLAEMFGMPYIVKTSLIPHSLRQTGYLKMIPMVVFEGGESLRIDEHSIREGMKGVQRVMSSLKMIDKIYNRVKPVVFEHSNWMRAARSGIFILNKRSGEKIRKGDILGEIIDPNNEFISRVKAKYSGTIYGHNNSPVVSQGDALFHIGYTGTQWNGEKPVRKRAPETLR